ncbi:TonB-dependent receptor, partial [Pseudomonadales bacterium]|nr:TonB-dependent receptor [Pseudomonadales bacterium]
MRGLLYLLAFLGGLPITALAEEMPEITVTAEFRPSNDIETLTSVTVLNDSEQTARGASHLEDLLGLVPNLNFASGASRARFFQIRGIGERSQFSDPINPSVGIMIDGMDFSNMGTIAHLTDLDQIEVLRGPQGTRFGANGLAGLIAIKSRDPEPIALARIKASLASFSGRNLNATLNQPLSDETLVRLSLSKETANGLYRNQHLNKDDTNGINETHARLKILNTGANYEALVTLLHANVNNGFDAFSLDNTVNTLSDEPGFDRQKTNALAARLTLSLDKNRLEMLGTLSQSELGYGYDEDWSFVGIHPYGYQSTDHYLRDRSHQALEIRLLPKAVGEAFNERGDWVIGLYRTQQGTELTRLYTFAPGPYTSDYQNDATALYAELDFNLSDKLRWNSGARIERRSRTFSDSLAAAFNPTETLWGGRIGLQYHLRSTANLYLRVSRGFKAGGFNTDGTLNPELLEYDAESLIETELGFKTTFAATRLKLALFRADRRDQQIKSSFVRPRSDGSTEFVDFVGNAAEGVNQGIEVELEHQLSTTFSVRVAGGLLDTVFTQFINEFGEDLGGRDQAQAPRYTGSVALNYQAASTFFNLSIDAKDDYYFSDRHAVKSRAYTTANAAFGLKQQAWELTFWGRNLTDQTILTRGFGSFG